MKSLYAIAKSHPKWLGFILLSQIIAGILFFGIIVYLLCTVIKPLKVFSQIEDNRAHYEQAQVNIAAARERSAEYTEQYEAISDAQSAALDAIMNWEGN